MSKPDVPSPPRSKFATAACVCTCNAPPAGCPPVRRRLAPARPDQRAVFALNLAQSPAARAARIGGRVACHGPHHFDGRPKALAAPRSRQCQHRSQDRRSRSLQLTRQGRSVLAAAIPIWTRTHARVERRLAGVEPDLLAGASIPYRDAPGRVTPAGRHHDRRRRTGQRGHQTHATLAERDGRGVSDGKRLKDGTPAGNGARDRRPTTPDSRRCRANSANGCRPSSRRSRSQGRVPDQRQVAQNGDRSVPPPRDALRQRRD